MSLTEYFQQHIKTKGYHLDDVHYDVSFSQGSGCAFYGALDWDGIWTLAQRLMSGHELFASIRAFNLVGISIDRNNQHHCHEHTMTVNNGDVENYFDPSDEDSELTELEFNSFNELVSLIKDDVVDIATNLHHDFERLFLSQSNEEKILFDFKTKQYRIVVEQIEDDSFFEDDLSAGYLEELIKTASDDNLEIYGLNCEIYSLSDNELLTEEYHHGLASSIRSDTGVDYKRNNVFFIIKDTIQNYRRA